MSRRVLLDSDGKEVDDTPLPKATIVILNNCPYCNSAPCIYGEGVDRIINCSNRSCDLSDRIRVSDFYAEPDARYYWNNQKGIHKNEALDLIASLGPDERNEFIDKIIAEFKL